MSPRIYRSRGVHFFIKPRSTGNNQGFTGRNEHGEVHLHAVYDGSIFKVDINSGAIQLQKGNYEDIVEKEAQKLIAKHKQEILKQWETQVFYEIKNIKDHK